MTAVTAVMAPTPAGWPSGVQGVLAGLGSAAAGPAAPLGHTASEATLQAANARRQVHSAATAPVRRARAEHCTESEDGWRQRGPGTGSQNNRGGYQQPPPLLPPHPQSEWSAGAQGPHHGPVKDPAAVSTPERRSSLARLGEGPLSEYADSVMEAFHTQSQRVLPDGVTVARCIEQDDREQILNWLVQTCEIMHFHESVLYSTVMMLDRYGASVGSPLQMAEIQRVLMAVICTVLKTNAVQDELCFGRVSLSNLLRHLFRDQAMLQDIFHTERSVLMTLDFKVTAPSPFDFLAALVIPVRQLRDRDGHRTQGPWIEWLSNFLLHLSLYNPAVHYGFPHAILAASAVHLALTSLEAGHPEARGAAVRTLMVDVSTACPDVSDVPASMRECRWELYGLWSDFARTRGFNAVAVMAKFGTCETWVNYLLQPPAAADVVPAFITQQVSYTGHALV